jgi:hypothetical protein
MEEGGRMLTYAQNEGLQKYILVVSHHATDIALSDASGRSKPENPSPVTPELAGYRHF